jgi:hypothetical protein
MEADVQFIAATIETGSAMKVRTDTDPMDFGFESSKIVMERGRRGF